MLHDYLTLNKLDTGSSCRIVSIKTEGIFRRRILDLGFIPNTLVKTLFRSPASDPTAYELRGSVIALRSDEASQIIVEKCLKGDY